jgi:hypothetical protein
MYPFVISLLLFWGIAQGWAAVLTVAVTDRNGAAAGRARVFSAGSQTQTAGSFLNDGRAEFELEAGTYRVEIEYLGTSPAQVAPSTTVELVADDAKRIDLYFAKATWPISVVDRDGASSGRVLVYEVGAGGEELVLTRFFDSGGELELSLPPATYRFEVQYRGTNPAQVEDVAAAVYGDADQLARQFYFGKSTRAVSVVDRDGAGGGRVQTYRVGPEGEEGVASQFFDGVGKL